MTLLATAGWLNENLGDPRLRVVDGSWYLPAQNRDPRAEYESGHIPGAVFFDIDAIADRETDLPHMLPAEDAFAEAAGRLGISEEDIIVVYDSAGLLSAPRVWWTFRAFGALDVRVLDGGLPAWREAGHPIETGTNEPEPRTFRAHLRTNLVADFATVMSHLESGAAQLVDARSAARFAGDAPEPRAGLQSGHMPGARNLPFDTLVKAGRLVEEEDIRKAFEDAGVTLDKPIVTTCGSGVTASVLALALARIGRGDAAVYDGSWTEWASRPGAPIAKGAP